MLSAPASAISSACSQVNAGAFNLTNSGSASVNLNGFDAGEAVTFVFTGTGGDYHVDVDLVVVFQTTPSSTPQTYKHVMTSPSEDLLSFFRGTGGFRITLTATCSNLPSGASDASQGAARGFLLSRINGMLLNSPGAMSLLNRNHSTVQPPRMASAANSATNVASNAAGFASAMGLGAGLGNAMGMRANETDTSAVGTNNIQFSQSLSQLRRQTAQSQVSRDRMALGAGDGATLPLAFEAASPWDIWVEGRYSAFDDDAGNLDRDGHVGLLYLGGDFRVAQNLIVGALVQLDWSKDDSSVLAAKIDGNGWMIGPYMSMQVHDSIYFDLRAAWGRSNNDITLGAAIGTFDTTRWLVKGTLAGNWLHEAWRITPSAELAYVEEAADAFTNSAGTFVPGQDVSLGRLQFGPEIGYRFAHSADTFIEPFAALKGVWDFDNPNVAIIDGFVVGPGDFWGRLEGGLNVATSGGVVVRGLASWDGVGSDDYSGYTLQGIVNVPLN